MRDYADGHIEWFQQHGYLRDGVTVDDTIARVISRIDPEQFRACFINWMQAVHERTEGQLIAIDGKTLRSSYQRGNRQSTIHMVNAFACANKVVLGQVKTAEKSNEITAIPELIQLLDIQNTLVSIDAMGCQTSIAVGNRYEPDRIAFFICGRVVLSWGKRCFSTELSKNLFHDPLP